MEASRWHIDAGVNGRVMPAVIEKNDGWSTMYSLNSLPSSTSTTAVLVCAYYGRMRGFVFIDGSNFHFKLKQPNSSLEQRALISNFYFKSFAEWPVAPHELVGVTT